MFRRMKLFVRATALVGTLLMGCSLAKANPNDLPVSPFQARYEVYGSGFSIGEAIMTLTAAGPGAYQMSSQVRPNGLAALIVSGRIDEKVNGEIRDGAVRPDRYERWVETPKKKQTVQLRFDWPANRIQARDNQEQATLPLSPGVVDPLSLNLRVMWDLQRGRVPPEYALVDETELKIYQIKNEGEESLDTPLGKLRAVRISQSKPGKTRITTFWFAPDLRYLPVRVAQEKEGKELLRMEIRAVER
jgi:hypothetical protein